ncbi:unnamed protein product [Prorocentrum cordatum]|uniref:UDP-N-acetylglucosamine--peptide N-acetylglucosaminyltransferase SPINDLY n=1 Tax=Prorocentrum cordatum TaxID=2364126 RepID=A0ABN9QAN5_9DINO|nr:unnamed protein product [Polarella glacialis]
MLQRLREGGARRPRVLSDHFIWKQAIFFAERLVAECPCEEMTYLLALAYFHNQEISRAHWHLQDSRSPEARYLLARCCVLLQKLDEGEAALMMGPAGLNGSVGDVANGAAGLFLLGQIREKQSRAEQAIECYAKSVELCPFMWEAYERWSWLVHGSALANRALASSMAAKTFTDERLSQSVAALEGPAGQLPGAPHGNATASQRLSLHAAPAAPLRSFVPAPRSDREQHRRDRHGAADASGRRPGGGGGAAQHAQDARDPAQGRRQAAAGDRGGGPDGAEVSLAGLLGRLGTCLHAMHGFETRQAVQLLGALPRRHYETGYVLDLVGICHLESSEYAMAEQAFQQARRIDPRRVEGLEFYSTTLWHLGRDLELGHLAQQCLHWDQTRPQVWCVVGNCFSRQKEHDVAIKFFKRAIQLDPSFTYAYTLCGHEFVANEKFDKAVPMYEQAVGLDPRHYNAWWGLGNIYQRQEEHDSARTHLMKALEINRNNSTLRCYLGMVLDSLNEPLLALQNFDRAVQIEPQNGMAHFHKGCVLMSVERYEDALAALREVVALAPKDSAVHFQIGKVYMKLQQDQNALVHFNAAMDLNRDSKDYHIIKTHIEQLHVRGASAAPADLPHLALEASERAPAVQAQINSVRARLSQCTDAAEANALSSALTGLYQELEGARRGARRHAAASSSAGAQERLERQQFFPAAAAHPHAGHGVPAALPHFGGASPQPARAAGATRWPAHAPAAHAPAGGSPVGRGAPAAEPPRTPAAAGGGPHAAGGRGPPPVGGRGAAGTERLERQQFFPAAAAHPHDPDACLARTDSPARHGVPAALPHFGGASPQPARAAGATRWPAHAPAAHAPAGGSPVGRGAPAAEPPRTPAAAGGGPHAAGGRGPPPVGGRGAAGTAGAAGRGGAGGQQHTTSMGSKTLEYAMAPHVHRTPTSSTKGLAIHSGCYPVASYLRAGQHGEHPVRQVAVAACNGTEHLFGKLRPLGEPRGTALSPRHCSSNSCHTASTPLTPCRCASTLRHGACSAAIAGIAAAQLQQQQGLDGELQARGRVQRREGRRGAQR